MATNGMDDDSLSRYGVNGIGFSDGIVDNEYFGLTNSMVFNNYGNGQTNIGVDPHHDTSYYHYCRSRWADGTPLTYGGSGYMGSSVYCDYVFPGTSDLTHYYGTNFQVPNIAEWSEPSAGNQSFDRRALLSSGYNTTVKNNASFEVDVAFINAIQNNGNSQHAIAKLQNYADSVKHYFLTGTTPCGTNFISAVEEETTQQIPEFAVFPNPAKDVLFVSLEYDSDYQIRLFNLTGELLMAKSADEKSVSLQIEHLKAGFYLLEVQTENQRLVKKVIIQ